ncbi:uncharacterized protein LOC121711004 isoform X2 [Alosa sapidissima]|uniref:uncharacterized protein LOC121711004 isoform X2 n=1 Tax=Alosa sapidissima TaxID=34773 RepID=UPI001C080E11|nr:uncharacterized protein LOC121711004 isoform X2 [Alosa sapidissima]
MSVIMEHQGPTPHTLDPTPHTLDPAALTQGPTPHTLDPTPHTLDPAALTQDLTPHTQDDDGSGLLDMLALAAENDTLKMQVAKLIIENEALLRERATQTNKEEEQREDFVLFLTIG